MAEPRSPDLRARLREPLASGPRVPPQRPPRRVRRPEPARARWESRSPRAPRLQPPLLTAHGYAGADHERPPGTRAPAAGHAGRAGVRAAQAGAGRCEPGPRRGALPRRRSETRAPPPACAARAAASRRPTAALGGAGPGKQSGRPASLPGLGRVPPLRGAGDRGRSRLGRAGAGARVGSPALRSQTGRRGVDGGAGRGPTRSAQRCSRAPCLFFLRGNGSLCPHSI